MMPSSVISRRLEAVLSKIERCARESGRSGKEITLVAVSKNRPLADALAIVDLGVENIGESRVQEAEQKYDVTKPKTRLHMIGHLQSNKVRKALKLFDLIQSVDSYKLAELIDKESAKLGKQSLIFLEINSSGEPQKYGLKPQETEVVADKVFELQHVILGGLMTIAPYSDDEFIVRQAFAGIKKLFDRIKVNHPEKQEFVDLSMGMSNDYQWAIKEGSTIVRIGTALFGSRVS